MKLKLSGQWSGHAPFSKSKYRCEKLSSEYTDQQAIKKLKKLKFKIYKTKHHTLPIEAKNYVNSKPRVESLNIFGYFRLGTFGCKLLVFLSGMKCSRDVPFGYGTACSLLFQIATIRTYVKCIFLKASTQKAHAVFEVLLRFSLIIMIRKIYSAICMNTV
jgi:hypothetical protein